MAFIKSELDPKNDNIREINNVIDHQNGTSSTNTDNDNENNESSKDVDISKVDPIFILNQYMRSTAGNLLFQDLKKSDTNDKKKTKIAMSNTTSNTIDLLLNNNTVYENDGDKILHAAVLKEGIITLNRILSSNNITGKDSVITESRANANQIFDLNLQSVSLLNFGPYGGERVFYPLEKR